MGGLRFRTLYSLFTSALAPADRDKRDVRIERVAGGTRIIMTAATIRIEAEAHPSYMITHAVEYGEEATEDYQRRLIESLTANDPVYKGLGQMDAGYDPLSDECARFRHVMNSVTTARGVDAAWGICSDVLRAAIAARMNEVRDYKVLMPKDEVTAMSSLMAFTSGDTGVTLNRSDAPGVWQAFNSAIAEIASHLPEKQVQA